jgi:hypothetical protein
MKALGAAITAGAIALVVGALFDRWIRVRVGKHTQKILENPNKTDPRVIEDPKYGTLVVLADGFKITTPKGDVAELLTKSKRFMPSRETFSPLI